MKISETRYLKGAGAEYDEKNIYMKPFIELMPLCKLTAFRLIKYTAPNSFILHQLIIVYYDVSQSDFFYKIETIIDLKLFRQNIKNSTIYKTLNKLKKG